jgi:putative heme transporter
VVGAFIVGSQRRTLVAAGKRIGQLSLGWLAAALVAEVASVVISAELLHHLLGAGHVRVGRAFLIALAYAANAVSAVLPAGTAISARYAYRRLVGRDTSPFVAGWVLVASGVLSAVGLVFVGLVGAQIAGIGLLCSVVGVLAGGLFAVAASSVIILLAWTSSRRSCLDRVTRGLRFGRRIVGRATRRVTPHRTHDVTPRVPYPGAQTDPISLGFWGWLVGCGLAALNWVADWAALILSFVAIGPGVPWRGVLLAYVVSQVIASLPVSPGSVGLTEGAMSVALICIGVRPERALAAVLVYRLVSFWIALPVGWLAWLGLRRREGLERQVPVPAERRQPVESTVAQA